MLNAQVEHTIKSYLSDGIKKLTTAVIMLCCIMFAGFYIIHNTIMQAESNVLLENSKSAIIILRTEPNLSKP